MPIKESGESLASFWCQQSFVILREHGECASSSWDKNTKTCLSFKLQIKSARKLISALCCGLTGKYTVHMYALLITKKNMLKLTYTQTLGTDVAS